jgi:Tfp pilus assembly protein PilN
MRPVNLLPQSARPYVASGGRSGGAYVVIGVLAALVLGVAAYVLTTNQISSRKGEIARAKQETQAAQARTAGLQKFGDFSKVAQARVSAVQGLAAGRIDYERLLRETSRVLPSGVWLTSLDAEATGGASGSSAGATPSTPPASGTGAAASTAPSVHVNGCAKTQGQVATTLVRLRALHGADEVQLNDSGKSSTGGSSAAASSAGASGCGDNYTFDVLVTLTPAVTALGDAGHKVPGSLGGGS